MATSFSATAAANELIDADTIDLCPTRSPGDTVLLWDGASKRGGFAVCH
jgi:hypothetical protein